MTGQSKSDDAKLTKETAESLQRQIDDIVSGRIKPSGSANFRDFVEHKMAEDRCKKSTTGTPSKPERGILLQTTRRTNVCLGASDLELLSRAVFEAQFRFARERQREKTSGGRRGGKTLPKGNCRQTAVVRTLSHVD